MEASVRVELREDLCIRCASCASLVPGVFRVDARVAMVVRQPLTDTELRGCRAAMINCPVGAVSMAARSGTTQ